MREVDELRERLRRLGLMGSWHDRATGHEAERRDTQERYDAGHERAEDERDLLRGGDGFSWHIEDLYRRELDRRADAERRRRENELVARASRDEYPVDNNTWADDLQRVRRRPDLRRLVRKSIDFADPDRESVRQRLGVTRAEWDELAGRRSRRARTATEEARYVELGRRVDEIVSEHGPGGVKLICEAYSTNRVTIGKLRRAGRSFTG